jgi:putative transposase
VSGTFYYLCSVLDGYSRSIVHWDLRESVTEAEIEVILERAREKYPEAKPRIISDNGPQFIARDFKEFIRIAGMTHVRTSPSYPQSNGKLERWHKSLKSECLRPLTPLTREDALRLIHTYVDHYRGWHCVQQGWLHRPYRRWHDACRNLRYGRPQSSRPRKHGRGDWGVS